MAGTKKTDNHYLGDKIQLRIDHSPWPECGPMRVLDVFGGHGVVWRAIEKRTGRGVERVGIDKRSDLFTPHAHGDNLKVMRAIDLAEFNVIDLDAYGIPIEQLCEVFDSGYHGTVFVTAIQTMHGNMPKRMLEEIGFTDDMIKKAPTLFSRRGFQYLKEWLATKGVARIIHRSWARKHYFVFTNAAGA